MAWCRHATSYYLNQYWPRSMSPYGVTRPQWVNHDAMDFVLFISSFLLLHNVNAIYVMWDPVQKLVPSTRVTTVGFQAGFSLTPFVYFFVKEISDFTKLLIGFPLVTSFWINTLRPRQNGRHFADDMFKCIFLNENVWIPIEIALKFVPKSSINNNPTLFQIMARRRPGDKPLSEPMMVSSLTHICVTRPQ